MKKLILIVALTISTAVQADTCEEIEHFARVVMTARQSDLPLISLIKAMKEKEFEKAVIIMAYEKPLFNGKAYKDKTINAFANQWYISCLKSSKSGK
tara:strand:- start:43 stop:333 length:291 start_codon:yes stop_codon:yes gene_type:complete